MLDGKANIFRVFTAAACNLWSNCDLNKWAFTHGEDWWSIMHYSGLMTLHPFLIQNIILSSYCSIYSILVHQFPIQATGSPSYYTLPRTLLSECHCPIQMHYMFPTMAIGDSRCVIFAFQKWKIHDYLLLITSRIPDDSNASTKIVLTTSLTYGKRWQQRWFLDKLKTAWRVRECTRMDAENQRRNTGMWGLQKI